MIQLTTDLSEAFLQLDQSGRDLADAVEVGPWFSPQQVQAYRERLPEMPFYFHAADLIEDVGERDAGEAQIAAYLACTGSVWVSVHLSVWNPGEVEGIKAGQQIVPPDEVTGRQRLLRKVERLAACISIPILIENVEPLEGYGYWSRAEFISGVIEASGCGLLLDTGHARIAADWLGMELADYLQGLPLESVIQIHISGPRRVAGRLADVHQPLEEEDYEALEFVLARTHPQVVTLEYIQDGQLLGEQLVRLRNILSQSRGLLFLTRDAG
jgi:uncharacterized protein (UPF0276 family)